MKKITIKLGKISEEKAKRLQYELSVNDSIYRVFINPYLKEAKIIFDDSRIKVEEILEKLKDFQPNVSGMEEVSLEKVIEESMSWNHKLKA
ncbi:DUF3213 domain-containing protein [Pyrococcus kukulkanii]|uniref:DUF3213 domain-containing protein n=1 Tax=Pyrococcus kukulkanii TaxID=1609559 RepID=UPI000F159078|nr:MAG: hypothetical protein DRN82_02905 [Thermococci archaeon]